MQNSGQDGNCVLGEELFNLLREEIHFEDDPFWVSKVESALERMQKICPEFPKLRVVIPWMEERTAFTAPGRFIYFSRRLLELFPTEEQVAFVLGHEMAHQHLGHVDLFKGWLDKFSEIPGASLVPLVFMALERRVYGPERECDADRYAADLCGKAGYDAKGCLEKPCSYCSTH